MIRDVHQEKQVTVIVLEGSLEVGKQEKLKDDLLKQVPPSDPRLVLDFSGVDFIDSACLGALVGLARRLRETGGDVKIASPTPEVKSIFQITRLDRLFEVFATKEAAVSSYMK
ncbi:MAG: STAS domain-containing protein [Deltaproteobacteria bacterium]|nr:STAS domain-containing protein [Deltaproteobacteria bacterium]